MNNKTLLIQMVAHLSFQTSLGFAKNLDSATTKCDRSGIEREVRIVYENSEKSIGCKVFYRKKDEGRSQAKMIWQSQYESGFCQNRANELIAQLKEWGWRCRNQIETASSKNSTNTRLK